MMVKEERDANRKMIIPKLSDIWRNSGGCDGLAMSFDLRSDRTRTSSQTQTCFCAEDDWNHVDRSCLCLKSQA